MGCSTLSHPSSTLVPAVVVLLASLHSEFYITLQLPRWSIEVNLFNGESKPDKETSKKQETFCKQRP